MTAFAPRVATCAAIVVARVVTRSSEDSVPAHLDLRQTLSLVIAGYCAEGGVMRPIVANLKLLLVTLPWAFVCFLGRTIKRFFIALGVLVVLGVLSYVGFESIVETIDSRYSSQIDAYLGIERNAISRLHDP